MEKIQEETHSLISVITVVYNDVINIEILGDVPQFIAIGIQVLTALLLGGLVGMDRESKLKAAGLKTNMLICIGATLRRYRRYIR